MRFTFNCFLNSYSITGYTEKAEMLINEVVTIRHSVFDEKNTISHKKAVKTSSSYFIFVCFEWMICSLQTRWTCLARYSSRWIDWKRRITHIPLLVISMCNFICCLFVVGDNIYNNTTLILIFFSTLAPETLLELAQTTQLIAKIEQRQVWNISIALLHWIHVYMLNDDVVNSKKKT